MKNSTLKLFASLVFLLMIYVANAQDQTICEGAVKNYTVDTLAPDGADPDGTSGSTYAWSVIEAGFAGAFTDVDVTDNKATIDWDTTPIGTYTVQVIETNGTCVGDPITFTVEIVTGPDVSIVEADQTPICDLADAAFNITGTPEATVTYTLNGGANQTILLDGTGNGQVDASGETGPTITIVIVSVANGTCTNSATTATTATITVNAAPITSPIIAL